MSDKFARSLASVILAVVLSLAGFSPALAAPPANDTFAGATLVSIGFSEQLDTSEATTDADDAQLNTNCGAPATDASVWYAIDGTDTGVIVDVSQSDYSAGVLVGVGSQGSLDIVACGPGTVGFFAAAGTTYYVLAIDDQFDGSGNGGNLSISFNEAPPPPSIDITVNRYGTFTKSGSAIVSGTYTCTDAEFADVFIEAHQHANRFTILGFGEFFDIGTCDGSTHTWSAEIFPVTGKFKGGKTLTLNFSLACGPFECFQGFVEQTVQLRGGKQ